MHPTLATSTCQVCFGPRCVAGSGNSSPASTLRWLECSGGPLSAQSLGPLYGPASRNGTGPYATVCYSVQIAGGRLGPRPGGPRPLSAPAWMHRLQHRPHSGGLTASTLASTLVVAFLLCPRRPWLRRLRHRLLPRRLCPCVSFTTMAAPLTRKPDHKYIDCGHLQHASSTTAIEPSRSATSTSAQRDTALHEHALIVIFSSHNAHRP
jgi:hypothetical protein